MEKDIKEQETNAGINISIMEKDIKEQEESAAPLTMANKVLNIGDGKSEAVNRNKFHISNKQNESQFDEEFKKRLDRLMLSGTVPSLKTYDKNLIEHFNGQRIDRNGKTFYQFDCGAQNPAKHEFGFTVISGPTCNGKSVLNSVRKRLKDMNWISNNVVECQRTNEKEYSYMHSIITDCMYVENIKLYNYILYLQQQFRNDN